VPDAATPRPRGHPGRLVAIVAVVLALTIGWPVATLAFSSRQPLPAGQVLIIGPDATHQASLTLGAGWVLQKADTNPKLNFVLRNGPVRLSVIFVFLLATPDATQRWHGLRQLLTAANPAARLSGPQTFTNGNGVRGQRGVLQQGDQIGLAVIYPSPKNMYAVELISLGPPGARAAQQAAQQVARSVTFPAGHR